ncbi:uncharacterized protein LOC134194015 [Corticium candelabrum]|uniref:uncharacterized protein LOC134194015 n=1 Tax=Corticium candelabrum TaxID=121492 RepID=UPI002E2662D8|nr:uncharacterized protein LOC134194015 [Corticium candelabrum]
MFQATMNQRISIAVILVAVYCLHVGKAQCVLEGRVYQPRDTITPVPCTLCECVANQFSCRIVEDCYDPATTPTPVLVSEPIEACQEPIIIESNSIVVYTIGSDTGDVRLI